MGRDGAVLSGMSGQVAQAGAPSVPRSEHRFPAPSSNSARTGYAPEEAFFISEQLSTDAVSALRKVWV